MKIMKIKKIMKIMKDNTKDKTMKVVMFERRIQ